MRRQPAVPIQRESLGPRVAAALREAIAAGDLQPGARLIEVELAEKFGVSRGPVRDAFRILQAEGLVATQQPGMVVTGMGPDDINELYSLRGAIEGLAIRLATGNSTADKVERIGRLVDDMQRAADANDPSGFSTADISFHNEICVLSGHKRLADVWQQYKEVMMTLLRLTIFLDQDLQVSTAKHRDLLDLIKAGDPAAAEEELTDHLEGSRRRMVQVWEKALERQRQAARL